MPIRLIRGCVLAMLAVAGSSGVALAACHDALMPFSSLQFRRSLLPELREIGIVGFGRTQPFRDATISVLLGTEVNLVVREQDDLAIEIGAQVPLPAEPLELAKFNALVSHVASRLTAADEPQLRARLLTSILTHATPDTWTETLGSATIGYARGPESLVAKIRLQKCDGG